MSRAILLLICCAALLSVGAANASGAVTVDPGYGTDGVVLLPGAPVEGQTAPKAVAVEPDGGLIVATDRTLQRVDPAGHLDPTFGSGGTVTPPAVAGGSFEVTAAALDAQGRIVVVGTSFPDQPELHQSGFPPADPSKAPPSNVRILRYLTEGSLDPTFGEAGAVETNFGLPIPVVEATGVAIDGAGRIVLTGGAAAGITGGCYHDDFLHRVSYAAYVARLTESGELDTGFARGGVFGGRSTAENPLGAEDAEAPVVGPGDGLVFRRGDGHCGRSTGVLGFVRLSSAGSIADFDWPYQLHGRVVDAAVEADGSVVLLLAPLKGHRNDSYVVEKLRPDGRPDRTFGGDGRVALRLPAASYVEGLEVAADGEGLLQGEESRNRHPPRKGEPRRARNAVMLMGLTAAGSPDALFGPKGIIAKHLPRSAGYPGDLWLDSEGRATITASYRSKSGSQGLAAVRFLLGR